uniref:Uncharacterized protein n=1 Tax=viral metagenome TaxID=1070528 RepID=A0A6C0HM54_9ZZZZ
MIKTIAAAINNIINHVPYPYATDAKNKNIAEIIIIKIASGDNENGKFDCNCDILFAISFTIILV